MMLSIERFESDATGNIEGPIVQVSDDIVTRTFPESEYENLTGLDLLNIFRAERLEYAYQQELDFNG